MTAGEKGYVQFRCDWTRGPAPAGPEVEALRTLRDRLHALGLIGAYPDGTGFGNLSHRLPDGGFAISGTRTGHLATLGPEHFTRVTASDTDANWLRCSGPVSASSESLSHAAVYDAHGEARCVVHVHHLGLWKALLGRIPTTGEAAEAGTPEMARAVERLFRETEVGREGVLVMGGHPEGLMSFGASAGEAEERLLQAWDRLGR